ncbi:hypothetical protein PG326_01690 [Riemerella anatipestifer]|nr:hypothetical protein [Riemerella anatipestifer]MDY3357050.1 hypothetical protein [Riemerella anatipestifer]
MQLLKKVKIKKSEKLHYKILLIIIYPFLLILGLIVMLFAGLISLFQKKSIEENSTKNSSEEWLFFAEYKNVRILKKYLNEIRFGPEYFELKSEPENIDFKNKIFGDWFYKNKNMIFLQQWNSTDKPNTNLLVFDAEKNVLKIVKENIDSVLWEAKNENEENFNLVCNTGYEINTYRVKKNYT